MDQQTALNIMKAGHSVFLTGSAGAGKTWLLNAFIRDLRKKKVPVAITASTGIAATHMNGMTIHSFCGIGRNTELSAAQLKTLMDRSYLKRGITKAEVLIIDEVSMLHRKQLDLAERVISLMRNSIEPFGGLQVVFCGDFFQLPPVSTEREESREKFAFMADSWQRLDPKICYLDQQFRQKDDDSLNRILNEIRQGNVTQESKRILLDSRADLGDEPMRLYSHNWDVDHFNQQRLEALPGKTTRFKAEGKGNEKLLEVMKKSILAHEEIELKPGARVVMLKNSFDKGYVNGSMGTVTHFDKEEGWPVVRLDRGPVITVEPEEWSMENEKGGKLATYKQLPLRLAWAITVHKSQGMTLDAAELDLGKCFEPGQGYVALSRLRSLDGLHLKAFNGRALEIDPLALEADQHFREQSMQAEVVFAHLATPSKIKRGIGEYSIKKPGKQDTYSITEQLIREGKTLAEMAEIRGLTTGTIAQHIQRLAGSRKDIDFSKVRPDETLMVKVKQAILSTKQKSKPDSSISEMEKPRIGELYHALKGEVSYDDLKLALAFAEEV